MNSKTRYRHLLEPTSFNAENIGIIGIPTKDRPVLLKRLLDSISEESIQNFKGSLVIIDSSTKYARQCEEIVGLARARLPCSVVYRRPHDTERMIEHIASHVDIDSDLLRICFLGKEGLFSAGGARNELLLLQGGASAIQIDDDIILNYKQMGDYDERGIKFTSQPPLHVKTFLSRGDIESNLHTVVRNPVSMYEDFFRIERSSEQERECDVGKILEHRIQHPDAHILYVQNGLYGDSCVQRFFSVQQSPEKNPHLYSVSEDKYHILKQSTHVIQSVESPTVTDHSLCIAAYMAITGERISPPFPPIGRGEDFLAGVLARQCCVGSFSLHLGTLIEHNRDEIIPVPRISSLSLPPSNRILAGIIGQNVYGGTTEDNLRDAGLCIRSFSETDLDVFQEYLIRQTRLVWKASSQRLEEKVQMYHHLPDYWKDDMRLYIQELVTSEKETDTEILGRVGDARVWRDIQSGYIAYGRLLQKWSEVWKVSLVKGMHLN